MQPPALPPSHVGPRTSRTENRALIRSLRRAAKSRALAGSEHHAESSRAVADERDSCVAVPPLEVVGQSPGKTLRVSARGLTLQQSLRHEDRRPRSFLRADRLREIQGGLRGSGSLSGKRPNRTGPGGNRTHTLLRERDFESRASANSAAEPHRPAMTTVRKQRRASAGTVRAVFETGHGAGDENAPRG